MGRLIDADALIEFIDAGHLRHPSELCFSEVDVVNMLNHAPTAYNVDAVVAELGEFQKEAMSCAVKWAYEKSINAVRRGGVE